MKNKKLQSILQLILSFNSTIHKNIPQLKIKRFSKPSGFFITLMVVTVFFLASGLAKLTPTNLLSVEPAIAQRISPGEIWQQVYQELPDFPKENQYISKETGKVAENNTLASRLIRYHIYVKERAPNYRLDWKLTLADYLGANEIMYDSTYPGNELLRQNPIEGDRTAIARLTRTQRNTLVQVLVNIFNSNSQNSQPK